MYSFSTLIPAAKPPLQSLRLLDLVRERIRYLHYSLRSEQAYLYRVRAFIRSHGMRPPRELAGGEVEQFLNARVRIKDVDFDRRVIVVRNGKGGKDRPLDRTAIPA